jgi:hypothetical protein
VFFIRAGQFLAIAGFFWYLFFPKEKYFALQFLCVGGCRLKPSFFSSLVLKVDFIYLEQRINGISI